MSDGTSTGAPSGLSWFAPLECEVSRIGLGTLRFDTAGEATWFGILDAWVELGGNVIDTAALYGDGGSERVVGRWLRSSGARDKVVLLTKGGYPARDGTSRTNAKDLRNDLVGSLDRLGVDRVDIFMPHTDDPSVPVGEVLDGLDGLVRDGMTRSVGASNWTPERLGEAAVYATANGRTALSSSSVQWSLAERVRPFLPGNISARAPEDAGWYARTRLPVFAWSGLASGYFREDAADGAPSAADAYDSEPNRERRTRAAECARRIGRTRVQVALAWVLNQPAAPNILVGPTRVDHLREVWSSTQIALTEAELAWLDRG